MYNLHYAVWTMTINSNTFKIYIVDIDTSIRYRCENVDIDNIKIVRRHCVVYTTIINSNPVRIQIIDTDMTSL